MQTQTLFEKISVLPVDRICEVEDFVDFLQEKVNRQAKEERFQSISRYAEQHAESDTDFDADLEQASLEILSEEESE